MFDNWFKRSHSQFVANATGFLFNFHHFQKATFENNNLENYNFHRVFKHSCTKIHIGLKKAPCMLQITPWANLILGVDQRIVCSYINTILKLELDCRKNIANNKQFSICIYSCYSSTESWKYHPSPHFPHCCHWISGVPPARKYCVL